MMKVKSGFMLYSLGEENVVVPIDERAVEFQGMIQLNQVGAFLWENMQKDFSKEKLVNLLLETYEVERNQAEEEIEVFLDKLLRAEVIELCQKS